MIQRRQCLAMLAACSLSPQSALAGPLRVYTHGGYAIGGTDPVGYFLHRRPVPGSQRHTLMWRGAVWRFETAHTQALFERNPRRFAPSYGGYCAVAMTQAQLSVTDPNAWAIHDDRLFLIHSVAARDVWLRDPQSHIAKANQNWPDILLRSS